VADRLQHYSKQRHLNLPKSTAACGVRRSRTTRAGAKFGCSTKTAAEGRFSLFGSNRVKGFNAAFAEGSAHWLPATVPEEQLRAMVTRNGGDKVEWER
jgi:hypothetical protein